MDTLPIGRSLSTHVIATFECTTSRERIKGREHGPRWYGMFDEHRLTKEIIPKLAEYVATGRWNYPFLVQTWTLEDKTIAYIKDKGKEAKFKGFKPRGRRSPKIDEAIVYADHYKLLRRENK